jgi:hypothetical protein
MMLLALAFSNSALTAADASDLHESTGTSGPHSAPAVRARAWQPGVDKWDDEKSKCPIFFRHDVEGFGVVRVGPRCADDEIPYAL